MCYRKAKMLCTGRSPGRLHIRQVRSVAASSGHPAICTAGHMCSFAVDTRSVSVTQETTAPPETLPLASCHTGLCDPPPPHNLSSYQLHFSSSSNTSSLGRAASSTRNSSSTHRTTYFVLSHHPPPPPPPAYLLTLSIPPLPPTHPCWSRLRHAQPRSCHRRVTVAAPLALPQLPLSLGSTDSLLGQSSLPLLSFEANTTSGVFIFIALSLRRHLFRFPPPRWPRGDEAHPVSRRGRSSRHHSATRSASSGQTSNPFRHVDRLCLRQVVPRASTTHHVATAAVAGVGLAYRIRRSPFAPPARKVSHDEGQDSMWSLPKLTPTQGYFCGVVRRVLQQHTCGVWGRRS